MSSVNHFVHAVGDAANPASRCLVCGHPVRITERRIRLRGVDFHLHCAAYRRRLQRANARSAHFRA